LKIILRYEALDSHSHGILLNSSTVSMKLTCKSHFNFQISLRAHGRQAEREVRCQHARQRGRRSRADASPDPPLSPELRDRLLRPVVAGQHQDPHHALNESGRV
jgi:hypothetical protein